MQYTSNPTSAFLLQLFLHLKRSIFSTRQQGHGLFFTRLQRYLSVLHSCSCRHTYCCTSMYYSCCAIDGSAMRLCSTNGVRKPPGIVPCSMVCISCFFSLIIIEWRSCRIAVTTHQPTAIKHNSQTPFLSS